MEPIKACNKTKTISIISLLAASIALFLWQWKQ